ncbi:hypothetical protein C2E25_16555 [Geothermobacter hydrogeniphilus]|uniref:Uncharacterized protein n=1 Tax=Geothermobacter hydrogeniphilus TaxID=1969733 RepID=A0A2K2H5S7_9BACT|nr:hypothetical protein [Geothermobacter hydrogeniphilus]PNU18658.1 hypothetical protein C2E25_16555 [Geothermobacter hydrogeniphilus]
MIKLTPKEVLESTTDIVKGMMAEIIKIEKEYQHYQNLSYVKDKEKEVCLRIKKLIERKTL